MHYYFKVIAIVDEIVGGSYTMYAYESSIKTVSGFKHRMPKELKEEILKWAENKFNETNIKFDKIVIEEFTHTYQGIDWMENRGVKLSEDMLEMYEISKKECSEYEATIEGQKEFLINIRIPHLVFDIKDCRDLAEKLNMLDSQEYLNFLDELNKLSIDQDRPNTTEKGENLN